MNLISISSYSPIPASWTTYASPNDKPGDEVNPSTDKETTSPKDEEGVKEESERSDTAALTKPLPSLGDFVLKKGGWSSGQQGALNFVNSNEKGLIQRIRIEGKGGAGWDLRGMPDDIFTIILSLNSIDKEALAELEQRTFSIKQLNINDKTLVYSNLKDVRAVYQNICKQATMPARTYNEVFPTLRCLYTWLRGEFPFKNYFENEDKVEKKSN